MNNLLKYCCSLIVAITILPADALYAEDTVMLKRVRTQFIAALANPDATSGSNAQDWGLWVDDPGPTGVWLRDYQKLTEAGGRAPFGWKFDTQDWWLDENGLLMEKPQFPLPAGHYLVTGDREVTTLLTIHPQDAQGNQRWELDNATLFDVTHMPCRTARYTPQSSDENCSPVNADQSQFKVAPGATMPTVPSCHKQDYAVLLVIAVAKT